MSIAVCSGRVKTRSSC